MKYFLFFLLTIFFVSSVSAVNVTFNQDADMAKAFKFTLNRNDITVGTPTRFFLFVECTSDSPYYLAGDLINVEIFGNGPNVDMSYIKQQILYKPNCSYTFDFTHTVLGTTFQVNETYSFVRPPASAYIAVEMKNVDSRVTKRYEIPLDIETSSNKTLIQQIVPAEHSILFEVLFYLISIILFILSFVVLLKFRMVYPFFILILASIIAFLLAYFVL